MAAALEALATRLAGDALVMVDPNCRPSIASAGYRGAARARARARRRRQGVRGGSRLLAPGVPAPRAARALLDRGPAVVLLTLGGAGAVAIGPEQEAAVPAPRVDVVDTIGAGDAFSGGWLAHWAEHGLGRAELAQPDAVARRDALRLPVAALTCARAGASPPRRAELEQPGVAKFIPG